MILFNSCPRCSTGDLMKTEDPFGEYVECLQCGYVRDIESEEVAEDSGGKIIDFPSVGNNEPLRGA